MSLTSYVKFLCDEIGLLTLLGASRDIYIIILLRMIRLIGFGGTALVIVIYLKELKFHEEYIGLFMTLTFVGDLVSSFLLSLAADTKGKRNVLIFSSLCMLLTGAAFSWFKNAYVLTIVSIIGILTPSGGEVGPFRSVEQSSIATLAPPEHRSDIYAWYNFLGAFCAAFGAIFCGAMVDYSRRNWDYSVLESYRLVFIFYTFISCVHLVLSYCLTGGIEINPEDSKAPQDVNDETTRLLETESNQEEPEPVKRSKFNILPTLNKSTYALVLKLSILFGLDAFASSLVPGSWQSYYLKQKFNASASYLGSVFFITGIISSFMSLLSTPLTKRIGPVVTMVVTHLPSSILLALVPIPNTFEVTMGILVIRATTQSMDVAPKHVFLAAIVPPGERTSVFGFVNVVKTLAQVVGPTIVGIFTKNGIQWVTFSIAGCLKAIYDVGILATFLTFNRHQLH